MVFDTLRRRAGLLVVIFTLLLIALPGVLGGLALPGAEA